MSNRKTEIRQVLILLISGIFSISLLGLVVVLFINSDLPSNFPLSRPTNFQEALSLESQTLTIGILSEAESYTKLASYLQNKFGDKVEIFIDGNSDISYQEAKDSIAAKEWDVAFTLSPMIGVAAKDNDYTWVARMFPDYPAYYQSALFVRADSPIRSISDLENTTVIALGDFNSASSFYMPTYDLYGKSLTVDMGHRGQKIREMVITGKADVGAAAYGDTVQNDPEIRIIHISRNIPASGVYLSPNLSVSDREIITQVLLNAPHEIKKQANYGVGEEPDYSSFIGISRRAEEVLACADFTKNPVNFFCGGTVPPNNNSSSISNIVGIVNGVTQINTETLRLTLAGQDNNVYHVFMSQQLLNQVPGAGSIFNLQNKQIRLTGVTSQKQPDGISKVTLNLPSQITVLEANVSTQNNSRCRQGLTIDARNLSEISSYEGCQATIIGRVETTSTPKSGKVIFLNLGSSDYNQAFTVVIFENSFDKFEKAGISPKQYYNNKTIAVTGEISDYQGRLQIIADSPTQIQLQ